MGHFCFVMTVHKNAGLACRMLIRPVTKDCGAVILFVVTTGWTRGLSLMYDRNAERKMAGLARHDINVSFAILVALTARTRW